MNKKMDTNKKLKEKISSAPFISPINTFIKKDMKKNITKAKPILPIVIISDFSIPNIYVSGYTKEAAQTIIPIPRNPMLKKIIHNGW
ncbi:hypothetical protein MKO99_13440 [Heyndrickxia coagulans]|nr:MULTISPECIES: hypothetical protein [Heyndrickxia]UYT04160.1 hypothetical protein OF158_13635 [Weizmannia sp. WK01]WGU27699.1 hypothetical protein MKO99_13440 [Heyndrickxia coagulans]